MEHTTLRLRGGVQPSPSQRNVRRQCPGVRLCYDVPLLRNQPRWTWLVYTLNTSNSHIINSPFPVIGHYSVVLSDDQLPPESFLKRPLLNTSKPHFKYLSPQRCFNYVNNCCGKQTFAGNEVNPLFHTPTNSKII